MSATVYWSADVVTANSLSTFRRMSNVGNHILTLSTNIIHQWSLQWLRHLGHCENSKID